MPIARSLILIGMLLLMAAACAPMAAPQGPAITEPSLTDELLVMADGNERITQSWLPRSEPKAVILALHGFNDYANAFDAPATALADHGIATFAYDQRGFGRDDQPGIWPGETVMVADALAALNLLRDRYPGKPLYLMGESMGGAVAIMTASQASPDIAGLILVAPAVWARSTMPASYRVALWLAANLAPGMTLRGSNLEVWPSDNIEMLRALSADPHIIKETRVDAVYGLVNLMDNALARPSDITLPVLLLYGANDQVVPAEPVGQFVAGMQTGNRIAVYDKGYHMLLRDLEARLVIDDIAAWIAAPESALPSGAEIAAATFFTAPPEPASTTPTGMTRVDRTPRGS